VSIDFYNSLRMWPVLVYYWLYILNSQILAVESYVHSSIHHSSKLEHSVIGQELFTNEKKEDPFIDTGNKDYNVRKIFESDEDDWYSQPSKRPKYEDLIMDYTSHLEDINFRRQKDDVDDECYDELTSMECEDYKNQCNTSDIAIHMCRKSCGHCIHEEISEARNFVPYALSDEELISTEERKITRAVLKVFEKLLDGVNI
ncbi:unnamed protein product, partial [Meganyctiphanes norvegica]